MGIERIGIWSIAAQQYLESIRRAGTPVAAGVERHHRERQRDELAPGDCARHQAARLRFKYTSRMETAAGVTPATRAAWPTVAGRICASFCRTSFDSPVTRA